jgi:SAM-dependent methyltransferase
MSTPIEQHNIEIHQNRKHWDRKPGLRAVYGRFYREIAARIRRDVNGRIVELGSGLGNIKAVLPECITTDIFPNPWIDQVEDAYQLSFESGSVSNLILFDVWHHLQFPGSALKEFGRVLAPGGRIIIFDPAMGLIGRIVFGVFHREPLGLNQPITWEAPRGSSSKEFGYYAAQGSASRIFTKPEFKPRLADWRVTELTYFSGLAYVATGGFRGPNFLSGVVLEWLTSLDSVLSKFPWIASRMLVVLEAALQDRRGTD